MLPFAKRVAFGVILQRVRFNVGIREVSFVDATVGQFIATSSRRFGHPKR